MYNSTSTLTLMSYKICHSRQDTQEKIYLYLFYFWAINLIDKYPNPPSHYDRRYPLKKSAKTGPKKDLFNFESISTLMGHTRVSY